MGKKIYLVAYFYITSLLLFKLMDKSFKQSLNIILDLQSLLILDSYFFMSKVIFFCQHNCKYYQAVNINQRMQHKLLL